MCCLFQDVKYAYSLLAFYFSLHVFSAASVRRLSLLSKLQRRDRCSLVESLRRILRISTIFEVIMDGCYSLKGLSSDSEVYNFVRGE